MNYKYCATIFIGNAKHQILRKVALIDLKIFHRAVYFFIKNLGGVVWNSNDKIILSPKDYYKQYKRMIDSKFSRKLNIKDLKLVKAIT